jgi:hypothetical protein
MQRHPRYGEHTYEIRVSRDVSANGVVYVRADSLTVSNGALMLSIEITPVEDMEREDIEVPDSFMELPPVSVFAPGHWYTAVLVDEKHQPMYAELTPVQLAARRERRKGETHP